MIRGVMGLNLAAAAATLTFRLAQPYAFLPAHGTSPGTESTEIVTRALSRFIDIFAPQINPAWLTQMQELERGMTGDTDQPPNHQWATRVPLVFPWTNMVRFGMGWPLGLMAWFGCVRALWQMARCPGMGRQHALPVTWILLFFGWQASQWAKCMRYLFPIYPILVVMAAWAVGATFRRSAESSRHRRWLGTAVGVIVFLGTYGWAFAFTRIYTRPHPRVAASQWIYQHLPSGSIIATEGDWDDALPLPTTGFDPYDVQYQNYALEMSWEDTPDKRARIASILDRADFIVISSNRFYDALSRNPRRWPMTLDYYRALFDGALGFELAAAFRSQPSLASLEIDDRWAEESFTVYDHPRVLIFRKTAEFSTVRAEAVLARTDLSQVVRLRADQVTDAAVVLTLPTVAR